MSFVYEFGDFPLSFTSPWASLKFTTPSFILLHFKTTGEMMTIYLFLTKKILANTLHTPLKTFLVKHMLILLYIK